MLEITEENFETEVLKATLPVLVDVFATWCGPCKTMAPVFEEVATDNKGKFKFGKVNVDKFVPGEIRAVPTLIIFKDGAEQERVIGALGKTDLQALVDKYK